MPPLIPAEMLKVSTGQQLAVHDITRRALANGAYARDDDDLAVNRNGDVMLMRKDLEKPSNIALSARRRPSRLMAQCVTMPASMSAMPSASTMGQAVGAGSWTAPIMAPCSSFGVRC